MKKLNIIHADSISKWQNQELSLLIFVVLTLILLSNLVVGLKFVLILFVTAFLILRIVLKDNFTASYLIAIFSSQFIAPNKYYFVQILTGRDMLIPEYAEGYIQGYGISLYHIFWVIAFIYFFVDLWQQRQQISWKFFFRKNIILIISAVAFVFISYFSSINFSPYFDLSFVWLTQYSLLFVVALLTSYFLIYKKDYSKYLFQIIAFNILFQGILALWQFFSQGYVGLGIETGFGSVFGSGLDENNSLYRVSGTLAYHNQLALYLALLTPFCFVKLLASTQKIFNSYFSAIIVGFVTIVLTQSRSIWIGCIISSILLGYIYKNLFLKLAHRIEHQFGKKKVLVSILIVLFVMSFVFLPRIILSLNAAYDGAGIPIRVRLITEAIDAFAQSPYIGYGIGTNVSVLHSMFPSGVMSVFPVAIHLAFLGLLLEVGVFGLFFLLLPFWFVIRNVFISLSRNGQQREKQINYLPFISGTIVLFCYYLFLPHYAIIEFQFIGILLGSGMAAALENNRM